tara:strand:- start:4647 stop:4925 length:279 start_codon:yes stop_codon:yes gene_type:complete
MYLEIISPEAKLFEGEISSIILPGSAGSFQLLNNHAPIVSTLTSGTVKIFGKIKLLKDHSDKFIVESDEVTLFKISSGTIEMNDNKVILLSD